MGNRQNKSGDKDYWNKIPAEVMGLPRIYMDTIRSMKLQCMIYMDLMDRCLVFVINHKTYQYIVSMRHANRTTRESDMKTSMTSAGKIMYRGHKNAEPIDQEALSEVIHYHLIRAYEMYEIEDTEPMKSILAENAIYLYANER